MEKYLSLLTHALNVFPGGGAEQSAVLTTELGLAFVAHDTAGCTCIDILESLAPEIAPFGIRTMLVEPGFFRTELLTEESTKYPEAKIDDYAETTRATVVAWRSMNGLQGGDPAKLARGLVQLAGDVEPPLRWAAGADAVEALETKARVLLSQTAANRQLSVSLGHQ